MSNRLSVNHLLISTLAKRKTAKNPLQAGFTLVELLIVVIIIGILAAVAVPAFLNQQGRARINASQSAAISAARACVAAQVTGEQDEYNLTKPTNVTGDCEESGTLSTFTSVGFTATGANLGTEAQAEVSADGTTELTVCAATAGWTAGTPTSCTPTRTAGP